MRFSTHSPAGLGKKYVDEPALWIKTEEMVRHVLKTSGSTTWKWRTKPRFTAED